MDCYLCKHCENLTNFPLDGLCEESPDGEHQWVTGEDVEIYVMKLWERPPVFVSNAADMNGMAPPA
jgi:hypothetical protein